ncbi:hypothetical protein BJY04DRAFT_194982 [Aspergillus karnatakaensis]|uniref:retropepsin-like aspartic protease n=1 Tax=Aspergillus karnatakaensis TaxID=1810916 RepID=UPI003CCE5331
MQPECRHPSRRPTHLPILRRCPQAIRRKLSQLSLWKLNRVVRGWLSRHNVEASVETRHSHRSTALRKSNSFSNSRTGSSASDRSRLKAKLNLSDDDDDDEPLLVSSSSQTVPVRSQQTTLRSRLSDPSTLSLGGLSYNGDFIGALDILVRLPGDKPQQSQRMVASLDTQCDGINLMRSQVWFDRVNQDGRGNLDLADDEVVSPFGSEHERSRVIGVARGLEWHFKNGGKTYKSDFHVINMNGFDVLIGNDTIKRERLLQPGADLQEHLEKVREETG